MEQTQGADCITIPIRPAVNGDNHTSWEWKIPVGPYVFVFGIKIEVIEPEPPDQSAA